MSKTRRKYSNEFKLEAVKYSYQSEKSLKEIADDLGITEKILTKWRGKYAQKKEEAFSSKLTPEAEELLRLKKENAELRQERDILKKAVAIFSK